MQFPCQTSPSPDEFQKKPVEKPIKTVTIQAKVLLEFFISSLKYFYSKLIALSFKTISIKLWLPEPILHWFKGKAHVWASIFAWKHQSTCTKLRAHIVQALSFQKMYGLWGCSDSLFLSGVRQKLKSSPKVVRKLPSVWAGMSCVAWPLAGGVDPCLNKASTDSSAQLVPSTLSS